MIMGILYRISMHRSLNNAEASGRYTQSSPLVSPDCSGCASLLAYTLSALFKDLPLAGLLYTGCYEDYKVCAFVFAGGGFWPGGVD